MAEGKRDYVYLDWAATAPLCRAAADAMRPFLDDAGSIAFDANANSLHSPGRRAFELLERARRDVAAAVGARRPNEIIFTGGATEADNAALVGMAYAECTRRSLAGRRCAHPRIITTQIEHDAVLKCVDRLAREGFNIVKIGCDQGGFIDMEQYRSAFDEDTVIVSVQAANAEIGSVQPLCECIAIAHDARALFHTDAVQAFGKVPFDADALGVDAATFAAHKIGGPKGVGALYLRSRTPFDPLLVGGGQESGKRSGTQNVCGAVGFAAAASEAVAHLEADAVRQRALRDELSARLASLEGVRCSVAIGEGDTRYLPSIVHITVDGVESETMVLRLDERGFAVSGGSACSSHSLEPSKVLKAIGMSNDRAYGALRISFGPDTSGADLDAFAAALEDVIGAIKRA